MPYSFSDGDAVVYNDKLHLLGGDDNPTKHYAYNGSTWSSESTLPYDFYWGGAVVYNNELDLLGGAGNKTGRYAIDGTLYKEVN